MTVNVLIVGRKSYLASQICKSKWASCYLFDPTSIAAPTSREWNTFEQTLKYQQILLYLHQPSRKNFELDSVDYINSALETAKEVLTRAHNLSNAKVLFTGSYWQGAKETDNIASNNYTLAKDLVQDYISSSFKGDYRSASLHLSDIYGPNDFRDKLIPILIKNWKSGRVTKINKPNATFAPIHVADVVNAIKIEALETSIPEFHVHSILPKEIFTVRGFIERFIQIFPETKVEFDSDQKSDTVSVYSSHDALDDWSPQIDLRNGLEELRKLNR